MKTLGVAFFSSASWGSDDQLVFVTADGADGNGLGGVRRPHVRTTIPEGESVGGPLGVYRCTHCGNDPVQSTFILGCRLSGDENVYNMAGGTFTPYTALGTALYGDLYPTHEAYTDAVRGAAERAAAAGWILAEEAGAVVAAAEQRALAWPGSVPEA